VLKVVLVDDHKLFRDGLRKILETESDIKVEAEAGDGEEALAVIHECLPDIVLFDINMPRVNGLQLAREMHNLKLRTAMIAVSAYDDEDSLAALSAEGVLGFVLKSSGRGELVAAVHSVSRGQAYVDPHVAGKLMINFAKRKNDNDLLMDLTSREKEIFYWLAQGLNNSEIAQRMVLSEKTVKNHVSHILKKFEIRDRTQAAIMAWRIGFAQISPDTLEQVVWGTLPEKSEAH
jgi:DNA-binding NarL/FixJ family response regulator